MHLLFCNMSFVAMRFYEKKIAKKARHLDAGRRTRECRVWDSAGDALFWRPYFGRCLSLPSLLAFPLFLLSSYLLRSFRFSSFPPSPPTTIIHLMRIMRPSSSPSSSSTPSTMRSRKAKMNTGAKRTTLACALLAAATSVCAQTQPASKAANLGGFAIVGNSIVSAQQVSVRCARARRGTCFFLSKRV